MSLGDAFNPNKHTIGSKRATFAMIPNSILCNPDITATAKMVLARLLQFAGDDAKVFAGIPLIACEVGISERQVQRCIKELEDLKLVKRVAQGHYRTNQFCFLRCDLWDMVPPKPKNRGDVDVTRGDVDVTPEVCGGVTSTVRRGDIYDAGGVTQVSPIREALRDHEEIGSEPASSPSSPDQNSAIQTIEAILREFGIRHNSGDAAELLRLAGDQCSAESLAEFIDFKRHVQTVGLFKTVIRDELAGWLRRRQPRKSKHEQWIEQLTREALDELREKSDESPLSKYPRFETPDYIKDGDEKS